MKEQYLDKILLVWHSIFSLSQQANTLSSIWSVLLPQEIQQSIQSIHSLIILDSLSYSESRLLLLLNCDLTVLDSIQACFWLLQIARLSSILLSHSSSIQSSLLQTLSQLYVHTLQPSKRQLFFSLLLAFYLLSDSSLQLLLTSLLLSISQTIPLQYTSPFIYPSSFISTTNTLLPYLQFFIDDSLLLFFIQLQQSYSPSSFISFSPLIGTLLSQADSSTQSQVLHYLLMQVDKQQPSSLYYLYILASIPLNLLK